MTALPTYYNNSTTTTIHSLLQTLPQAPQPPLLPNPDQDPSPLILQQTVSNSSRVDRTTLVCSSGQEGGKEQYLPTTATALPNPGLNTGDTHNHHKVSCTFFPFRKIQHSTMAIKILQLYLYQINTAVSSSNPMVPC